MSVPVHAVEPPRSRPAAVTAAGWLLFGVAAVQIISLVVLVTQVDTIADVTEDAYRGTSAEDIARVSTIAGTLGGAILGALFAIAYIVLAIFNNRGKNPSRITTWAVGGVGVCCGTLGLVGNAVRGSFNLSRSGDDLPDPDEVQRRINDALPSWYRPITITLGLVALMALLVALILLALPPSNEFFRKPQPVWQPPGYPPAGYPPPSGYTQPTGYPTPGGYPPPGGYYPPPGAGRPPPGAGQPPPGSARPSPGAPPPGSPPPQ